MVLVQEHLTLTALEARRVPLQVGRHTQDELVVDLATAAHAERELAIVAAETCVVNEMTQSKKILQTFVRLVLSDTRLTNLCDHVRVHVRI